MSNSQPAQLVLIDDTDPRIQYQEGWVPEVRGWTERPDWGTYGPPHNHTLTQITTNGSFTFKYNGTTIEMQGTTDASYGRPKPTWKCFIDNQPTMITGQALNSARTNHWSICDSNKNNIGFGEHTFRFEVTVPAGGAFWFDQLKYDANEPMLAGEMMYISDDDPSVTYSPANNFNLSEGIVHLTDIPGSSVTLKFTGSSASLFAMYKPNLPASKGFYSLDGQPSVPFDIPKYKRSNVLFNQEVFRTPDLPPTEHTLITTFDGQPGDTPLSVDYFYVTLPPKYTQSETPKVKHSTPIGAIVGGVVGGVALSTLVILIVFILWRRRQQRKNKLPRYKDKPTTSNALVATSTKQPVPVAETDDSCSSGKSSLDSYVCNPKYTQSTV